MQNSIYFIAFRETKQIYLATNLSEMPAGQIPYTNPITYIARKKITENKSRSKDNNISQIISDVN